MNNQIVKNFKHIQMFEKNVIKKLKSFPLQYSEKKEGPYLGSVLYPFIFGTPFKHLEITFLLRESTGPLVIVNGVNYGGNEIDYININKIEFWYKNIPLFIEKIINIASILDLDTTSLKNKNNIL